MNHYAIEGPALISFSGGRTSGFMLRQVMDAHGGTLPATLHVVFANTGRERTETLDFVHEVGTRWEVPITWVEYTPEPPGFRVVTHATASRDGEPFTTLLRKRAYLPNPVTRFCTSELKIRPMRGHMRGHMRGLGLEDEEWTNVIGIRADEPRRAARMADRNREGKWDTLLPMYRAGHTAVHVAEFWARQPFDLRLRPWEGNCDLCFLKGVHRRLRVIEDRPELAAWWIEREAEMGKTFRIDAPRYSRLLQIATTQMRIPGTEAADLDAGDLGDCFCGDGG